jgi:predicted RNase H-like nuclease (RuvC/YqgF family)
LNNKINEQNTIIGNLNKDQTGTINELKTKLNNQKNTIDNLHKDIKYKYDTFKCNGPLPRLKTWQDFLN